MVRLSLREQRKRRLKAARAGAGLSQIAAADRTSISRSRFWRLENAYDDPTSQERERIARIYHKDESELWPEFSGQAVSA